MASPRPVPGHAHLGGGRQPVEALEELVTLALGDTGSFVEHLHPGVGVDVVDDDMHAAAAGRELDGVGEEVAQELVQPGGVAEDRLLGSRVDGQDDAGHRGRGLDGVHRVLGQPAQVQLGEGHAQAPPGARVGQQVLGHPLQVLRVALDRLEHAHLALGQLRGGVEQQLDEAPDRGDGRAQLVGDGCHDVVLHLGQLAQPVVLLDQRLRHFLLNGVEALPVGGQLLALGDVDGHHHVAAVGRQRARCPGVSTSSGVASASFSTASASSPHSSSSDVVGGRHGERPHPHDAAAQLAVLAGGGPRDLGRRLRIDRFERSPHGVDRLAPLVDLGRVDEVGDGVEARPPPLPGSRASAPHRLRRT